MKLFLASEAKHPESLEKLKDFVGGFDNKSLVYIPTASNGEFYGAWKGGQSVQAVISLGAKVDIIELESHSYQNVTKAIGQPDILWIAGGMSGYLLYWMRRLGLDKIIPTLLEQGTIYVGSSAGSMVCSKTQNVGEWYLGEPEPGASHIPGLGLVDFEIYPHYQDELYPEIDKHWQKGKLCLLKNGEAITIDNEIITILGEERFIEK